MLNRHLIASFHRGRKADLIGQGCMIFKFTKLQLRVQLSERAFASKAQALGLIPIVQEREKEKKIKNILIATPLLCLVQKRMNTAGLRLQRKSAWHSRTSAVVCKCDFGESFCKCQSLHAEIIYTQLTSHRRPIFLVSIWIWCALCR